MDKNIDCYRRYIGPLSLLSANAGSADFSACFAASQHESWLAGGPHGLDLGAIFAAFAPHP
ncbi:MAG TPA: hypothetical protein VJS30_10295 [Paraburkholderia sp.]|nr:hypothetical protein [Paraburkholderia sp.]